MLFFGKKSPVPFVNTELPLVCDMSEPFPIEASSSFLPVRDVILRQKAGKLKRQLRAAQRSQVRSRITGRRQVFVAPEQAPVVIPPPAPASAPAFDSTQVAGLVAQAPVVVEMQYEVLDLRHEIEALKSELAALRAKASEPTAELKAGQLSIADAAGKVTARISSAGVLTCQKIEFHAID